MTLLTDLLPEVKTLSKIDKIRLMQLLISEIALDEGIEPLIDDSTYEIWSPYGADEAAGTLQDLLDNDSTS